MNQPKTFIETQRIQRLEAPQRKVWACLRSSLFRNIPDPQIDPSPAPSLGAEFSDCRWGDVENRRAFLAAPGSRGLCIVVNAGLGKTTALRQAAYLRATVQQHLVIRASFRSLPSTASEYLSDTGGALVELMRDLAQSGQAQGSRLSQLSGDKVARLIRHQIRRGRFSLIVDALDETQQQVNVAAKAEALASFLGRNPKAECVVAGGPLVIYEKFWHALFATSLPQLDWTFARVCRFTKVETQTFLGENLSRRLSDIGATALETPRSLEVLLELDDDDLTDLTSASRAYARAANKMLRKALDRRDFSFERAELPADDAWELLGLMAFEMTHEANFAGFFDQPQRNSFDPESEATKFIKRVWSRRRHTLSSPNLDVFRAKLRALGSLNEFFESKVEFHDGLTELVWKNRTWQAFFAADWLCNRASLSDLEWSAQNSIIAGTQETAGGLSTEELHETWQLATEMPSSDSGWVSAMSGLYNTHLNSAPPRSTEMLYRSWPRMLRIAIGDYEKSEWSHAQIALATRQLQHEVRIQVESGSSFDGVASARQVVVNFLSEFPMYLRGDLGKANQDVAMRFDASFQTIGRDLTEGQAFLLSDFSATNEILDLFDGQHRSRYGDYSSVSPMANCPAIYLSWYDAWALCLWSHSRLPTSSEWTRACQGDMGVETPCWWGDIGDKASDHAWVKEKSGGHVHAAGEPGHCNGYGLWDMLGNVLEWTSDADAKIESEHDDYHTSETDMLRGGAFLVFGRLIRTAGLIKSRHSTRNHYFGTRMARDLPTTLASTD